MRRAFSILLLPSLACFSPDGVPPEGTETGSTGDTPSSGASMTSTMSATTDAPTSTTPGPDDTTASAETAATQGSTGVDSTTSDGESDTTSDTGPLPACEGFDGRVIYVNMSGAELTMGIVDNAPANITSTSTMVGVWPGYTSDDADELYAMVEDHWAGFDVCLTRDPPAVPDYTMIVVSSESYQDNPNFIGFGVTDCGDSTLNSVNIIVLSEEAGLGLATKAIGLSKHIAHTFGLNSVADAPNDIMNQFVGNTLNGAMFTDACHLSRGEMCDAAVDCAAGEQQSAPYLEMLLGPS